MSDNVRSSNDNAESSREEEFSLPDAKILIEKAKIAKKERLKMEEMERKMRLQDPVAYIKMLQGEISGPPRVPQAYGYARVSTDEQFKQGDSISAQMESVKNYYLGNLVNSGVGWGGIECDDFGVSAFKNEFIDRPAGKRLMKKLRRGDHLIIDKVDRVIRKMKDVVFLIEVLGQMGIRVHFVAQNFDPTTENGKLMLHMMSAIAEYESGAISQRVKSRNRWARSHGHAVSGIPPYGTMHVKKNVGGKWCKLFEWNKQERALMNEVVRLRDKHGLSFKAIAEKYAEEVWLIRRVIGKKELIKKRPERLAHTCARLYCIEKFYQDHGIMDTKDVPIGIHSLAIKYCITKGYVRRQILHYHCNDPDLGEYNQEWEDIRKAVKAKMKSLGNHQGNGQKNGQGK